MTLLHVSLALPWGQGYVFLLIGFGHTELTGSAASSPCYTPWAETPTPPHSTAPGPHGHLHKLQVLVGQLALGQLVFLGDPRVLQDLLGCEALVGVHMQHLRYQVLETQKAGR